MLFIRGGKLGLSLPRLMERVDVRLDKQTQSWGCVGRGAKRV
jgi:hypothetical protein